MELAPYRLSGRLPCALAFRAAREMDTTPAKILEAANRDDLRVSLCQLGLFGFDDFGEKRYSASAREMPQELREALAAAESMTCVDAWRISDRLGVPRLLVGAAANELGIRITQCQLGCFP